MCHLPGPGEVSPPAPAAGQTGHGRRLKDSAFRSASWASCSLRGFYWAKTFSFCAFRHEKPQGTPGSHARSSPLSAAPPPHPPQGSGARAQPEADAQHPPSDRNDVTGREESRELPRQAASGRTNRSLKGPQRPAAWSGGSGRWRPRARSYPCLYNLCTIHPTAPPAQGHGPAGAGSSPLTGRRARAWPQAASQSASKRFPAASNQKRRFPKHHGEPMGSSHCTRGAQSAPGLCPRPPGSRGRAGAAALCGRRGGGAAAALGVVIAVAAVVPVPPAPPPAALPRPHSRYGRGEGQTLRIPVPPRHLPPEEGVPRRGRLRCRSAALRVGEAGPARPFPRRGAAAPRRGGAAGPPRPSRGESCVRPAVAAVGAAEAAAGPGPPEGSPRLPEPLGANKGGGRAGAARWGSTTGGLGELSCCAVTATNPGER